MNMQAYLLAKYTDIANQYGWFGFRQLAFRLQFWFDSELQQLIGNARHVRRLFQTGAISVSDITDKV